MKDCAMESRLQLEVFCLHQVSNSGPLDQKVTALPTGLPGLLFFIKFLTVYNNNKIERGITKLVKGPTITS